MSECHNTTIGKSMIALDNCMYIFYFFPMVLKTKRLSMNDPGIFTTRHYSQTCTHTRTHFII